MTINPLDDRSRCTRYPGDLREAQITLHHPSYSGMLKRVDGTSRDARTFARSRKGRLYI